MLVKVTQEHIDKAKENIDKDTENFPHSCNCPVAAALKDTFKVSWAIASYSNLTVGIFPVDNIVFSVSTPTRIVDWMYEYDKSINSPTVEPFEFELFLEGVKL